MLGGRAERKAGKAFYQKAITEANESGELRQLITDLEYDGVEAVGVHSRTELLGNARRKLNIVENRDDND